MLAKWHSLQAGRWTVLFAWLLFVAFAIRHFQPDSSLLPLYNSDNAIAVLMSNEERMTPFAIFYYGQDRSGGWPFLFANLIHVVAGLIWKPSHLSALMICFCFSGAWPLFQLAGRKPSPAVLYLAVMLLHPAIRTHLFELGQPYGWQSSAILWSWLALRRFLEKPTRFRFAGAAAWNTLAVWSSSVSGPLLAVIGSLEWFRSRAAVPGPSRRRAYAALGPVLLGILAELGLRNWYHRYSRFHFGHSYATPLRFDTGHLLDNARALGQILIGNGVSWLLLPGIVACSCLLVGVAKATNLPQAGVASSKEEYAYLSVGLMAMAAAYFATDVGVSHVRANDYNERYLTLVQLFGTFGSILSIATALAFAFQRHEIAERLIAAVACGVTLFGWLFYPSPSSRSEYRVLSGAAEWLGAQGERPVVVGSYWGTYVFASLAFPQTVIPVPAEGEYQRTPWTEKALNSARVVFLSLYQTKRFGSPESPKRWLRQSGTYWRRLDSPAWRQDSVVFRAYQNETRKLTLAKEFALENGWDSCSNSFYRVTVPPLSRGEVVLSAQVGSDALSTQVLVRTQAGQLKPALLEESHPDSQVYGFSEAQEIVALELKGSQGSKPCPLSWIAVFAR